MTTTVDVAAEIEAIRQVKARYCRFLDTKDEHAWRAVFTDDVVMYVDLAVSTGGADPMTSPPYVGVNTVVPDAFAQLAEVTTVHHCHTSEIELTSETTATGIWAMEDRLYFPDDRQLHGAGHYHETYEKIDGTWRIKTLHLTRTLMQFLGSWAE